jgi:GNAT superfamily N-acetyltransferase
MLVREFDSPDLHRCVEIGAMMHAESVYHIHPFSPERLEHLARLCLTNVDYVCFVAEHQSQIVGLMVGLSAENFFADSRYAADLALYVVPQHRGSTAAVRLVMAFIDWSKKRGCHEIRCGITTGINDAIGAKLYRRFGFEYGGSLYVKQISPL